MEAGKRPVFRDVLAEANDFKVFLRRIVSRQFALFGKHLTVGMVLRETEIGLVFQFDSPGRVGAIAGIVAGGEGKRRFLVDFGT